MKGSLPLLVAITLTWGLVWGATQLLTDAPLGTAPTVAIGLVATLVVVWGYPSAIRGPRLQRRLSAGTLDGPTGDALAIVNRTLPYLRRGLNQQTATRSARILLPLTGGAAVAIADPTTVLGTAGRRRGEASSLSGAGRQVLAQGVTVSRETAEGTEVCLPLRVEGEVAGVLVVLFDPAITPSIGQLESIANLVSVHLEMADLTQRAQIAADARLDALRAQINPHFLFNTLNTIASKSRTNPDEARQLLQRLADFFRYAIEQEGQFAEFAHEYFFVRTYLSLEKSRYEDRLNLHYDVDPQVLPAQVPVLTIQPLVENAVKHGLAPKPDGGTVSLRALVDPLASAIKIVVRDDGVGMEPDVLRAVVAGTHAEGEPGGVALTNIHQRLEGLYGARYRFDIRSSPGEGTSVELELPL